jgi:hypothetical protein
MSSYSSLLVVITRKRACGSGRGNVSCVGCNLSVGDTDASFLRKQCCAEYCDNAESYSVDDDGFVDNDNIVVVVVWSLIAGRCRCRCRRRRRRRRLGPGQGGLWWLFRTVLSLSLSYPFSPLVVAELRNITFKSKSRSRLNPQALKQALKQRK